MDFRDDWKDPALEEAERHEILNDVAIQTKRLAAMPLHSVLELHNTLGVQRVPGGWNYIYKNVHGNITAVTFVALPKVMDAKI